MHDHAVNGTAPAIECRCVSLQIGSAKILAEIDLAVAAGEQVAIIGASGAGKTSLLRLCAGVLWPSEGQVRTLGKITGTLSGRSLRALRRQVGFLYQQDNLIPGLRVAHNVLMGNLGRWSLLRSLWSLLFPQDLQRAHAALQRVEMGERLWALPGELSGGEQQRVAIARLLVQSPRVLLCDEPVSALDLRLGREVMQLITRLCREQGTTLLVCLHTLELLRQGFDRIIALRAGRIVFDGKPAQLTRQLLQDIYGAEYRALHLDELALEGRP